MKCEICGCNIVSSNPWKPSVFVDDEERINCSSCAELEPEEASWKAREYDNYLEMKELYREGIF